MNKNKTAYLVLTIGASIGLVASFWQLLEKLSLLKNPHLALSCNLNSVFNCSNILNAHQSSVFGFPNSLLCIILFCIALTAGLIGLTGAKIGQNLRFVFQGLALFTLGFGLWYFWQSIFSIGAICIFCIFCFSGVLMVNGAWFRLNYQNYPLSSGLRRFVEKLVLMGADIFIWSVIALIIVFEALIKFK